MLCVVFFLVIGVRIFVVFHSSALFLLRLSCVWCCWLVGLLPASVLHFFIFFLAVGVATFS